jgi:hypothetical protein
VTDAQVTETVNYPLMEKNAIANDKVVYRLDGNL